MKGRLVGKTETVGYLLYAHFGAFQILPREYHGDVTNPLHRHGSGDYATALSRGTLLKDLCKYNSEKFPHYFFAK